MLPQPGIKDIVDIILMALFLFYCYRVMRKTRALNLFYGVMLFVVCWIVVSKILEMRLLGSVFDQLINVGAIALIVLFQEEIRRFFYSLGANDHLGRIMKFLHGGREKTKDERWRREVVTPLAKACQSMAEKKIGALIVIQNNLPLNDYIAKGEVIDAKISQRLIENIFFKNSPLHDGALIIVEDRIAAAAAVLPVSEDMTMPKHFGLRHRAAKETSKDTDSLCVVVSEETGHITLAYNDQLKENVDLKIFVDVLMARRFDA